MKVGIRFGFSAGHTLWRHTGKCRNLHGHNYVVEVEIYGTMDEETGMVMDFGVLKEKVRDRVIGWWDHKFLIQKDDYRLQSLLSSQEAFTAIVITDHPPTAEWMALAIKEAVSEAMGVSRLSHLHRVRVWETEDNYAEA